VTKIPAIALAAGAAAFAGTAAVAAAPKPATARTHVMSVALPDGSAVRVEYVGDVAPKVTVSPGAMASADPWGMAFPSFAGFDRMIAEMDRQSEQMIRQAQQAASEPGATGRAAPYIAAYGNLPAGGTSTTVVSVSNGGATCTRSTQVVSQGPGKPPKVTSNVSGQCGPEAAPPPAPITRT
jgi:hypothetical protein